MRGYGRAASNPPKSGRSTRYPPHPMGPECERFVLRPLPPPGGVPLWGPQFTRAAQGSPFYPGGHVSRIVTILTVLVVCFLGTGSTALGGRIENQQARAKVIICKVFGPHCQEALRVSWCESKWYVWAGNGQYLGLFQMGSSERAKYGHGSGAWKQSRAAFRYFVASGKDWSPWSCKP